MLWNQVQSLKFLVFWKTNLFNFHCEEHLESICRNKYVAWMKAMYELLYTFIFVVIIESFLFVSFPAPGIFKKEDWGTFTRTSTKAKWALLWFPWIKLQAGVCRYWESRTWVLQPKPNPASYSAWILSHKHAKEEFHGPPWWSGIWQIQYDLERNEKRTHWSPVLRSSFQHWDDFWL